MNNQSYILTLSASVFGLLTLLGCASVEPEHAAPKTDRMLYENDEITELIAWEGLPERVREGVLFEAPEFVASEIRRARAGTLIVYWLDGSIDDRPYRFWVRASDTGSLRIAYDPDGHDGTPTAYGIYAPSR